MGSCAVPHLQVAPASANLDSILTGKDLGAFARDRLIKVVPPGKQVVRARVHVPVIHLCGRSIAQIAVGDQLHVRVVRLDGKVEGQIVADVGRMPAVLQNNPSLCTCYMLDASQDAMVPHSNFLKE